MISLQVLRLTPCGISVCSGGWVLKMPPNPCHRTSQHAETSVLSGGEALPSGKWGEVIMLIHCVV